MSSLGKIKLNGDYEDNEVVEDHYITLTSSCRIRLYAWGGIASIQLHQIVLTFQLAPLQIPGNI